MNTYVCNYCGRETTNPGANKKHEISCKLNPQRTQSGGFKKGSRIGMGKNQFTLAKELGLPIPIVSNETRIKMSESAKKQIMSDETKQKLSIAAIKNKLGGVTQSRRIKYKDKTLGSSYELLIVKSLDENGIAWNTCKRFPYIDPFGKKRTYTPDIYLVDYDVYLDPKNDFLIENINPNLGFSDKEKIKLAEKQNSIKVLILNKHQLDWNIIKTLL